MIDSVAVALFFCWRLRLGLRVHDLDGKGVSPRRLGLPRDHALGAGLRDPGGRLDPETRDHLYGGLPPLAAKVDEYTILLTLL